VDAAWAGSGFVVPEIREAYGKGLEGANSIAINFGKWMLSGQTSTLFYVSDKLLYNESFAGKQSQLYINPEYLKNQFTDDYDVTDYKDWQIGLGRRFNALRFWFMIRNIGQRGLREHILKGIELTECLSDKVKGDKRFEIVTKRELNLVTFRAAKNAKGDNIPNEKINEFNKKLLDRINENGEFFIVASTLNNVFFLRFTCGNPNSGKSNVEAFWEHVVKSLEAISS